MPLSPSIPMSALPWDDNVPLFEVIVVGSSSVRVLSTCFVQRMYRMSGRVGVSHIFFLYFLECCSVATTVLCSACELQSCVNVSHRCAKRHAKQSREEEEGAVDASDKYTHVP